MSTFSRKAVLMSVLLLLSLWASAQVYIGGSIAGSYVKSPSANAQSWSINVKPEAGYFLKSNLALGGRISYGKTVTKIEDANNKDTNTATNLLTINPYAAFAPYEHGKFSFWAECGLQVVPQQASLSYSSIGAYVAPAFSYLLGEHLLLKTHLGFAGLAVSVTTDGGFSFKGFFDSNDVISFGDNLSIGFLYKF